MSCTTAEENLKKAESLVRIAASRGAQVILLQELFLHEYFACDINESNFQLAETKEASPLLRLMCALAKELAVVLPISFFEKYENYYYCSVAMIDADGKILGIYRKTHVANRQGFAENYYFTPSDGGFKKYGQIGVGLSTDQWYPEAARLMVLQGAEILLYPSAIGNDPADETRDSKDHWQRVMQGHAAANMVPVIVSNRVGAEASSVFYGSSFISGPTGEMMKIADRESEGVLVETFALNSLQIKRASFGLIRDRRPDMYQALASRHGRHQ